MFFYSFLKSLLFLLDPESAHRITINYLRFARFKKPKLYKVLKSRVFGLNFYNPIGIAAGFDKNGEVAHNLINLGFGFSEIVTVTPKPQPGNSKPRVFRLKDDNAIINRLGFNSEGFVQVKANLGKTGNNIIGINIGANKNSKDFSEDYIKGIKFFSTIASYITINISSPNTPGLRNLEILENLVTPPAHQKKITKQINTCILGNPIFRTNYHIPSASKQPHSRFLTSMERLSSSSYNPDDK